MNIISELSDNACGMALAQTLRLSRQALAELQCSAADVASVTVKYSGVNSVNIMVRSRHSRRTWATQAWINGRGTQMRP